jgi:hypothetical protein
MAGTHCQPWHQGAEMSLQHIAGRIVVFEIEDGAQLPNPEQDLAIKDVLYVIMPPPNAD